MVPNRTFGSDMVSNRAFDSYWWSVDRTQRSGTVVITGCATGIGYACARRLSAHGFEVFAGVRRHEDTARVASFATPVVVDVTDDESVRRAAEQVSQRATSRLVGVVNNAGVSAPMPLELAAVAEVRLLAFGVDPPASCRTPTAEWRRDDLHSP
jgi:NAD(P)-dependent dehydrogenase (short-subunit alcohol dehydrogenase family)